MELEITTRKRTDFVNITARIQESVSRNNIESGVVTVFIPHTTAGVTINENADPDVVEDMACALEKVVPWSAGYAHSEGNSAAHVKASLMGNSAQIPVENGKLQLGIWQGVYFCEFDGPRSRKVWITE